MMRGLYSYGGHASLICTLRSGVKCSASSSVMLTYTRSRPALIHIALHNRGTPLERREHARDETLRCRDARKPFAVHVLARLFIENHATRESEALEQISTLLVRAEVEATVTAADMLDLNDVYCTAERNGSPPCFP